MTKVISDFKLQVEFQRSTFDSDKDWKRTWDWDPAWYRLGSKIEVFDYLRFYEIK